MERINESFIEGIKESTEIKMGVAHVSCNGVCVCVCVVWKTVANRVSVYEKLRKIRMKNKDENLIFKI